MWDELTDALEGIDQPVAFPLRMTSSENCTFLEDVTGLRVMSVGQYTNGPHTSCFDCEVDMVSLPDVVGPHLTQIMEGINIAYTLGPPPANRLTPSDLIKHASLLTLWRGTTSYDSYNQEWDSDLEYLGDFDPRYITTRI